MEAQLKLTFKNPNIPLLSWTGKKLWSPISNINRVTLTNASFQYFSEIGKRLKYNPRPTIKSPNFESSAYWNIVSHCPTVSLLKIKWIYIKGGCSHFKLNRWNIQFPWVLSIFHWNWIGKNEFFIGKNRTLNPLGILCIPQYIWLFGRPCWLDYV